MAAVGAAIIADFFRDTAARLQAPPRSDAGFFGAVHSSAKPGKAITVVAGEPR